MQHDLALVAALLATLCLPATAQVPVPSTDTTEWNFTGLTGDLVHSAYGPAELRAADGSAGQTLMLDSFTTTSMAGIPLINGVDATVLQFGPHCPNTLGYTLRPQTQVGNGGVGLLEFSLVFDFYLDANNTDAYQAILQTNDTNSNDAELHLELQTGGFWNDQNANAGGGSIGQGTWMLGRWNRVVFVNDYTGNFSAGYVNGVLAFTDNSYTYCYNGDQAEKNWILADQNCDCTSGWIANLALVDRLLTPQEAAALGGADAGGIFAATLGTNYCAANPNSTGAPGRMEATGSDVVANDDFHPAAVGLPNNAFGFFIASRAQGFVQNPGGSAGNLCLAGPIGRFQMQIQNSGAAGRITIHAALASFPHPSGGVVAVQPGDTWNFQAWHRDAVGGGATSNFTDGLSVLFR